MVYDALNEEERQCLVKIFIKISSAFQQIKADNEKDKNEQNSVIRIPIE